jgi:hypothetical protein
VGRALVEEPDLLSVSDNERRRSLLTEYRGYQDRGVFQGFPADVRWQQASLEAAEIPSLRYQNYDYFQALSGGTRLVRDGA